MGLLITQVLVWICASDPTTSLGAFDGVIEAWPTALSDPTTTPLMMAVIVCLEMCAVIIPLQITDWFWQHKGGRGGWIAWLVAAFGLSFSAFWAWGLTRSVQLAELWFLAGALLAVIVWGNPRGAGAAITASGRGTGSRGSKSATAALGRRSPWPSISRSCPRAWAGEVAGGAGDESESIGSPLSLEGGVK
jgi:hypothetical protein